MLNGFRAGNRVEGEVGPLRGLSLGGPRLVGAAGGQGVEQILDEHVLLRVVPQRLCGVYAVEVTAAALPSHDVPANFEVGDDLVSRALGDADMVRYLPGGVAGIVEDVAQHQPVIGDERPLGRSLDQWQALREI